VHPGKHERNFTHNKNRRVGSDSGTCTLVPETVWPIDGKLLALKACPGRGEEKKKIGVRLKPEKALNKGLDSHTNLTKSSPIFSGGQSSSSLIKVDWNLRISRTLP